MGPRLTTKVFFVLVLLVLIAISVTNILREASCPPQGTTSGLYRLNEFSTIRPCPVHQCPKVPLTEASTRQLVDRRNKQSHGKRHVVYVRIPKTGSSTISVILWQYAWRRNLSVLTTNPTHTGTQETVATPAFFLPPSQKSWDVMAEHVLYNRTTFKRFFPKDTVYVTLLREPMAMLYSSLYYIPGYLSGVPGENKIESYLRNPTRYDRIAIKANRSFTRNPQTGYLDPRIQHVTDIKWVNTVISSVGDDFPLVMILERLDESLVLLKRLLGWQLWDVIPTEFFSNNNQEKPKLKITETQRAKYRKWSLADHLLYEFFYKKLDEHIASLGKEFQEEVLLFRKLKKDIYRYCRFHAFKGEILKEPKTVYNKAFVVTGEDCLLYNTQPLVLNAMIRKRQGMYPYLHHSLVSLYEA